MCDCTNGGWQRIETAPKDGPAYLVWCPERLNIHLVCFFQGRLEYFGSSGYPLRETPTHWRPLPAPPQPQETKP